MFYYAVLNENNFVVDLVASETEIADSTYISITEEQYTSGDLLWLYYKNGQFIVCDNFMGSCDWIIYKNTNRPITPKFDEIDSQIAALQNAGSDVTAGVYTGNGKASQTVSLGFTPEMVFVCREDGLTNNGINVFGGMAYTNAPVVDDECGTALRITTNGFIVSRAAGLGTNSSTRTYRYFAV